MKEVTRILSAIEQGDPHAAEQLLPLVYDELRRLATQRMAKEKPGQTLQATALVHDAYLRLGNGDGTFQNAVPHGLGVPRRNPIQPRDFNGDSLTDLLVFTVTLSAAYDQSVTFSFATANSSAKASNKDYKAISGKIIFAPGETSKTITVWVYGDTKKEGNESLYLNLSGVTHSLISRSRGIGGILNDD